MNPIFENLPSAIAAIDWPGLLLDAGVKSSMILLCVFLVLRICRRASASTRHWIWLLAVLSLLIVPIHFTQAPMFAIPVWTSRAPRDSQNELSAVVGPAVDKSNRIKSTRSQRQSLNRSAFPISKPSSPSRARFGFSQLLFLGWVSGALLNMLRLVAGHLRLRMLRSNGKPLLLPEIRAPFEDFKAQLKIRRQVLCLRSHLCKVPITWGSFNPIIMLPPEAEGWSPELLRLVLRHELAHIKRHDFLAQTAASFICALYWFNPVVWWATREMRLERERACDDLVLNSGARPSTYAACLVDLARNFQRLGSIASTAIPMARPVQLETRVSSIVDVTRNRKQPASWLLFATLLLAVLVLVPISLCRLQAQGKADDDRFPPRLKSFFAEKQKHARALAKKLNLQISPDIWLYYDAAANGDWQTVGDLFNQLKRRNGQYEGSKHDPTVQTPIWSTLIETGCAYEQFEYGERKYFTAFAEDILKSMPRGSIYFGGTDPGRAMITAYSKSHEQADPVFTLTQNALADGLYLIYLREIYGKRLYIPTDDDSQKAFQEYTSDAQRRLEHDQKAPNEPRQVKPGENIKVVDGKVQVTGQIAVMAINGLLTKLIFDRNTNQEYYIEESFPLDWMYPHLSPNGLIMKVNRPSLPELREKEVRKDQDYWSAYMAPMIGGWLKQETSVKDICDYARKVYVQQDLEGFKGDPKFVANDYACRAFSKLRSSIAGVYAWRVTHAKTPVERQRMNEVADFAFRQAFALCPYSPEAAFRYINLLISGARIDDALMLAQTASDAAPSNGQFSNLIRELKHIKEFQK